MGVLAGACDDLEEGDAQTVHVVLEGIGCYFEVVIFEFFFQTRRGVFVRTCEFVSRLYPAQVDRQAEVRQLPQVLAFLAWEQQDVGWLDVPMGNILFLHEVEDLQEGGSLGEERVPGAETDLVGDHLVEGSVCVLEDDADFAVRLSVALLDLNIVVLVDLGKKSATVTMEGCCSRFIR